MDRKLANKAMRLASRGTEAEIDAFEDEQGDALSAVLDGLWFDAEEAGDTALAARLGRAFNKLTDREE